MGSSVHLENDAVSALVERLVQARRLYGADSSYVIGLLSGIGWFLERPEGGAKTRELVYARLLEAESGKQPKQPAEPAPSGGAAGAAPAAALAENTWIKGVVKWFNNDKGYGFISTDSHVDVFVHWRDISSWDRSLTQGDEVEFMVTRTAKGFQAINVMKGGQDAQQRPGEAGGQVTADEADGQVTADEADADEADADVRSGPEAEAAPSEESDDEPEAPVEGDGGSEEPAGEAEASPAADGVNPAQA